MQDAMDFRKEGRNYMKMLHYTVLILFWSKIAVNLFMPLHEVATQHYAASAHLATKLHSIGDTVNIKMAFLL